MIVYKIDFKERCNGINLNQLQGTPMLTLFKDYNGQIVDMRRFVATLNAYGFIVEKVVNNPTDTVYNITSSNVNYLVELNISKAKNYVDKNENIYASTIDMLRDMSKNAEVINNNVTNINTFQNNNQHNLTVIEGTNYKGTKYIPSIKKLFKERPKLAIALCTITAITTVAAGGFIVKTAVDRIETQKYLDNHKQQVEQTTAPTDYSLNNFIDETRKNDEMNYSNEMAKQQFENMKTQENEESNQKIR